MNSEAKEQGLLDGIRILDLADEKASFCTKILADLGARVVKIEKPGGDESRRMGPFGKTHRILKKAYHFFTITPISSVLPWILIETVDGKFLWN